MRKDFEIKEHYQIQDLLQIMRILRGDDGCPWDREQDHDTIRKNMIEETYEVVEAIDRKDSDMLCEELGDVLLQVVFHARMEEEAGGFNFDDVCDGICQKLILRHPHIFGDVVAKTSEQVLNNWDEIKKKTKKQSTQTSVMNSIPRELPALMRAQKVQAKAAKVGFDWDDVSGAFDKISEETAELKQAISDGSTDAITDELGDLIFSVVNVSRFIDVDSEDALTRATDKFISRFSVVEKLAEEKGIDMKTASLEKLDELWNEAKK
jgi:tetrapyrrole methylase family protein/MazG family protein